MARRASSGPRELSIISFDMRECECMQVLLHVYPQLVRHWKAAGNIEKVVHFLMEASAAAIAIEESLQVLFSVH